MIVADDFDWYLLIGDETALPSIGRRVEALREGVPVTSIIALDSIADQQRIETDAAWQPIWISRDGKAGSDPAPLLDALKAYGPLPEGDGYIWIAAEANVAKALKAHVVDRLGHPPEWMRAAGYWQFGEADAHVNLDK
jgi:NADPH-dependent ferric siderophore reductase